LPTEPLPTSLDPEPLRTTLATLPLGGWRFTAGGLVARSFGAWWRNLLPFVLLSVIASAPMMAGSLWLFQGVFALRPGQPPPPEVLADLPMRAGLFALAWAAAVGLQVVFAGALTFATCADLSGRRPGIREMLRVGTRRGLPVVGVGFAMWLGIVAGLLLLLAPGVMLACTWAAAIPAAVVERPGVLGALRRSAALTRGRRWQVLGGFLAILGLLWVITLAVQVASVALALPLGGGPLAALLASQLANAVLAGLPAVAMAVAYHDLRLEKEGVDAEEIVRVFA